MKYSVGVFVALLVAVVLGLFWYVGNHPRVPLQNADCVVACAHLLSLGCPEGLPLDLHLPCQKNSDCDSKTCNSSGSCEVSCAQFCADSLKGGVPLNPQCASKIGSCAELSGCL